MARQVLAGSNDIVQMAKCDAKSCDATTDATSCPACRHAVFVDRHHLELRSEGGDHDPDALVTLCSGHYRAQHHGRLLIEGRVSMGLVFRHADGSSYGAIAQPSAADTYALAFCSARRQTLSLNPHLHVAFLAGVYREDGVALTW